MNDESSRVRTTALGLLENIEISKKNVPGIVRPIFKNGSTKRAAKRY